MRSRMTCTSHRFSRPCCSNNTPSRYRWASRSPPVVRQAARAQATYGGDGDGGGSGGGGSGGGGDGGSLCRPHRMCSSTPDAERRRLHSVCGSISLPGSRTRCPHQKRPSRGSGGPACTRRGRRRCRPRPPRPSYVGIARTVGSDARQDDIRPRDHLPQPVAISQPISRISQKDAGRVEPARHTNANHAHRADYHQHDGTILA